MYIKTNKASCFQIIYLNKLALAASNMVWFNKNKFILCIYMVQLIYSSILFVTF